jgi:hypothetical protein
MTELLFSLMPTSVDQTGEVHDPVKFNWLIGDEYRCSSKELVEADG